MLGGEEHAALQTLKTAQRRFPHHGQLAQKVHNLERKIKQKSKVDYYKVLGVASSATAVSPVPSNNSTCSPGAMPVTRSKW